LFCIIGKCSLNLRNDLSRRAGDHARVCFDNQARIAFLLAGDDVIDDHGTSGRDCFLNRCPAGFADKQMAGPKHARKLIRPADDVDLAITDCGFDCTPQSLITSDGDG